MTAVAPELAAAGGRGDAPALRHRFARALRLTLTVIVPAAAVYVALARPIVVALLQRGAFNAGDATLVGDTLVGFAIGLPFFSTYLFSLRAFYSLSDTRTPFLLNCVENAVNIGLAMVFFDQFGIPGLAYAYSAAYAIGALLTLTVLSRRLGGLQGRGIGTSAVKILLVSVAAAAAAWVVGDTVGWASAGAAVLAVLLGLVAAMAVTALGLSLLKVEEFRELTALFRLRRFRRRSGRGTAPPPPVPPPAGGGLGGESDTMTP